MFFPSERPYIAFINFSKGSMTPKKLRTALMPHPSPQEISLCCESLSREVGTLALLSPRPRVLPLHPGCGQAIQAVYEDTGPGARKVVVTHWLADFSFSLPSIRHVIDSGLELRSVSNGLGQRL